MLAALDRMSEPGLSQRTLYERLVLFCYIGVAAYSGLRPVELHNLNWQHVGGYADEVQKPGQEGDVTIRAFGKTEPRNVVPLPDALSFFWQLREAFKTLHQRYPEPTDPVFCNYKGGRLRSVKRSLNALLDAAGLKTHEFGGARVAYSFRHFYISQQLLSGIGVYKVAINAGTSVEMIQKFYARLGPEVFREELRARWTR